ncbi:glycosyltransferase [Salinisphaera japonica]|uniref:Glycosyl transferase family 1 n=1 Tax=Salinisphaera japonica YTM-1 TaxID=1209778 RepID=A0A423PL91_9GAMM|nr:glycosyltransferase [Salinisphaera japonica]ROO26367.1 hypothetical protein SAJA_11390 [Salinisphaera japonica YTM-1]
MKPNRSVHSIRILLLNTLYAPNVGGVENSLSELAREFSSRGHDVVIVCSDRNYADDSSLAPLQVTDFATIYRYAYPAGLLGYLAQYRNCVSLIRALHHEAPFDLVISRSHITTLAARAAGVTGVHYVVPSVTLVRDWPVATGDFDVRSLAKYAADVILQFGGLRSASTLYAFSASTARDARWAALFGRGASIRAVSPGVSSDRFTVGGVDRDAKREDIRARHLVLPEATTLAIAVGRFSQQKRFDLAIRAMAYLPPSFHLLLVGEGPLRSEYRALIKEVGIEGRVTVCPPTSSPETYYAAADVFVMSSTYEPFGQTLLEATASGLPVAAFSSHGVKTAVSAIYREFPALVRYGSRPVADDLAAAIAQAATARTASFDQERLAFLEHYSWGQLADELSRSTNADT